ncbi:MAG: hypothetical protein IT572_00790 [Deltaproteobacteria bacterium]|nr:hypothetical protein [Deltaproteobacteria bacterium]
MRLFRHKWFVALFFCLISFGQAYPYSYAWALGQHEACGCNLSGRRCIHGCDLKKRPRGPGPQAEAMKHAEHAGHAGHEGHHAEPGAGHEAHGATAEAGHAHHGGPGHRHAVAARVLDEEVPVWVNPDCSRQQRREVLSFRGEPFLPQQALIVLRPQCFGFELDDVFALVGVPAGLDPPPPKA